MQQLKPGSCVFFKDFQSAGHPKRSDKYRMKNLAFGVLLGVLPPFAKDPTQEQLYMAMGAIGYVSFDDVAEILGVESGQKLLAEYEKKYYAPKPAEEGAGIEEVPIREGAILGLDGELIR